jgi:tRNA threonylcarbamoyladenosine biosynthesis protein TsaB
VSARAAAVLGFDTATAYAAVAVTREGEPVHEEEQGPDRGGRPRHSEALLAAIARCVASAGGWEELRLISVGLGPGSYTGLRIGIATARALAQARSIPIAGVTTLAALARGLTTRLGGDGRPALAVLDARRGEAFAALYGADGTELRPPFVASPPELTAAVAGLEPPPLAAGDGSLRFAAELQAAGVVVVPAGDPVHRVAGREVCALGSTATPSSPEAIEPIYLREPDAKRWLDRDRGKRAG